MTALSLISARVYINGGVKFYPHWANVAQANHHIKMWL